MDSRLTSLLPRPAAVSFAILLCAASSPALADTYYLPGDLSQAPFNCSGSGGSYQCGDINLSKDAVLVLNGPVSLEVNGNFVANKSLRTVNNDYAFNLTVGADVTLKKDLDATMVLTVGGSLDVAKNARLTGNVTVGGNAHFAKDSIYHGDVTVGGYLQVDKNTYITGICRAGATNFYGCGKPPPPEPTLHHVRIVHGGTALTCEPATITLYACAGADSDGACNPYSDGVEGTLNANGASVDFEIPDGSSAASVQLEIKQAGSVTLSASGYRSSQGYTCWDGKNANCSLSFQDAALQVSVASHVAASGGQKATLRAVKKDSNTARCIAALQGARPVDLSCNYVNPKSGGQALQLGDSALACNQAASTFSLTFDDKGEANIPLFYQDVGQLALNASVASPALTGSGSFVVAPARFAITPDQANPHKAGRPFTATVTALNARNEATPNFGRESTAAVVQVGFTKCAPAGGAAGVFSTGVSQSFDGQGSARTTNMVWSEVGRGNLVASLDTNPPSGAPALPYLGSDLVPSGSTASDGNCTQTFVPDHFDIVYTAPRPSWYSGQPMRDVKIVAKAYAPTLSAATTTLNYMLELVGGKVQLAAFSNAPVPAPVPAATGALDSTEIPGASFAQGEATITPTFTFTKMKTAPLDLRLRASEGEVVSSANGVETVTNVRTGRLRLSNAFGGANTTVAMPVRAEYWNGNNWMLNSHDSYTAIPSKSLALTAVSLSSNAFNGQALADATLVNGQALLSFKKTAGSKGYLDVALNLALSAAGATPDQSCLANHPPTVGSDSPWLRSWYGACSLADPPANDPSARINFGVTAPETRATVFVREVFN